MRLSHRRLSTTLLLSLLIVNAAEAGLVTHYDASALTGLTNGAPVNTLVDTSGNGNNAIKSSTAATVGTYVTSGIGGLPAVQFSGGNSSAVSTGNSPGYQSVLNMGTAFGISGDASFTEIFVFRSAGNGTAANDSVFSHIGALGNGATAHTADGLEIQGNHLDIATGFSNDATLGPGSYNPLASKDLIVTIIHQGGSGGSIGSTSQIFVDGFAPGQGLLSGFLLGTTGDANTAALNLANQPLSIAGAPIGTQEGFSGLLSEALIYNTALNTVDRGTIESQLGVKYGISTAAVPEPMSLILMGLGVSVAFAWAMRSRREAPSPNE